VPGWGTEGTPLYDVSGGIELTDNGQTFYMNYGELVTLHGQTATYEGCRNATGYHYQPPGGNKEIALPIDKLTKSQCFKWPIEFDSDTERYAKIVLKKELPDHGALLEVTVWNTN
jgi:hypothetical protein